MKPSILEMAKATPKSEPTNQEKALEAYKTNFDKLVKNIQAELSKYNKSLKDGGFEDSEEEGEGSGEKRKVSMQAQISKTLERIEKMNKVLKSGENIPEIQGEIQADFTYKNPDTGKLETQETITVNIEEKLEDFISFYQKTNIDLPSDFEDSIREIWSRNSTEMQQAIEEKGFDDILIIPANIPLAELAEKMKMGNGYNIGSNFTEGGGFAGAKSIGVDKPRLILYHKKILPEIKEKTGLDIHLNIKAGDAEKLYKANPEEYLSTLEDFLILERKNFEESAKHLSDYKQNSAHWLSGTKSGARFVCSSWSPGSGGLYVRAFDAGSSYSDLGCRPSRYFV
jgi:hypothetical protein